MIFFLHVLFWDLSIQNMKFFSSGKLSCITSLIIYFLQFSLSKVHISWTTRIEPPIFLNLLFSLLSLCLFVWPSGRLPQLFISTHIPVWKVSVVLFIFVWVLSHCPNVPVFRKSLALFCFVDALFSHIPGSKDVNYSFIWYFLLFPVFTIFFRVLYSCLIKCLTLY